MCTIQQVCQDGHYRTNREVRVTEEASTHSQRLQSKARDTIIYLTNVHLITDEDLIRGQTTEGGWVTIKSMGGNIIYCAPLPLRNVVYRQLEKFDVIYYISNNHNG